MHVEYSSTVHVSPMTRKIVQSHFCQTFILHDLREEPRSLVGMNNYPQALKSTCRYLSVL